MNSPPVAQCWAQQKLNPRQTRSRVKRAIRGSSWKALVSPVVAPPEEGGAGLRWRGLTRSFRAQPCVLFAGCQHPARVLTAGSLSMADQKCGNTAILRQDDDSFRNLVMAG